MNLETLFLKHLGKASDKWALYLREYDRLFSPYRDEPVALLEIGIQNGGSLDIWCGYFPKARAIIGCDINPLCAGLRYEDPRVTVVVADATTEAAERSLASVSGSYDLIIDDGSHRSGDVVRAFVRYFPRLERGGLFVVEDLHCSYWRDYEGGLGEPLSSMAFFKRLVDVVNAEHWVKGHAPAGHLDPFARRYGVILEEFPFAEIHSVEFVNSMCVIRKREAAANVLGPRLVAGRDAAVWPGIFSGKGSFLKPPEERRLRAPRLWGAKVKSKLRELIKG